MEPYDWRLGDGWNVGSNFRSKIIIKIKIPKSQKKIDYYFPSGLLNDLLSIDYRAAGGQSAPKCNQRKILSLIPILYWLLRFF